MLMHMLSKLTTELVGTFFLVLVVLLATREGANLMMAPVAIGAILLAMVHMGGIISGAHYNPAVTLGVCIRGRIGIPAAAMYIGAQLVGAAAACGAAYAMGIRNGGPVPAPTAPELSRWMVEILFSFALVLVVLNVATVKSTSPNHYYGVAIGMTVMAAAFAGGGISGGAFNPAVGVVPAIFSGRYGLIPLYVLGPCAGAVLAAVVFRVQHGTSCD
jgi:aquaporin Z